MHNIYVATGRILVVDSIMAFFVAIWYLLFPDYLPLWTPIFLQFYAIGLIILATLVILTTLQEVKGHA